MELLHCLKYSASNLHFFLIWLDKKPYTVNEQYLACTIFGVFFRLSVIYHRFDSLAD